MIRQWSFYSSYSAVSDGGRPPSSGYTLVEMVFVVAIFALVAGVLYPVSSQVLARNRVEGFLYEVTSTLARAKGDAIRFGVPVVVRVDFADRALVAFADYNRADGEAGSDLVYNPRAGLDPGTTGAFGTVDRELAVLYLPDAPVFARQVHFWADEDAAPNGDHALEGLTDAGLESTAQDGEGETDPGAATASRVVVFEPNGSVRDTGAIRFATAPENRQLGTEGNFYEVRIAPAATALLEIRKYVPVPPARAGYYPRDSTPGQAGWTWF